MKVYTKDDLASDYKRAFNFIIDLGVLVTLVTIFQTVNPIAIIFLYYGVFELFLHKTIGKLITRTHIIDADGGKITIIAIILRTAARLIPLEIFTFRTKHPIGLHDNFSNTVVVNDTFKPI